MKTNFLLIKEEFGVHVSILRLYRERPWGKLRKTCRDEGRTLDVCRVMSCRMQRAPWQCQLRRREERGVLCNTPRASSAG